MIEWVVAGRGRGNGAAANAGYYLTVAVSKTGRENATKRHQLCLRFSPDAVKDLRLLKGDFVHVGLDKISRQVCFKRTTDPRGAYSVSAPKTAKGVLVVQCSTELPWHIAVPIKKGNVSDVNGVVCLDVPEIFADRGAA